MLMVAMLFGSLAAAVPPGSRNEIAEEDGIVTVSVFIDCKQEPKVTELEGTAMVRTHRQLRKRFKELPKTFSVPSSVERAGKDIESDVYVYVTRIRRCDIDACIADYKQQEAERELAEKVKVETSETNQIAACTSTTNVTTNCVAVCAIEKVTAGTNENASASVAVEEKPALPVRTPNESFGNMERNGVTEAEILKTVETPPPESHEVKAEDPAENPDRKSDDEMARDVILDLF